LALKCCKEGGRNVRITRGGSDIFPGGILLAVQESFIVGGKVPRPTKKVERPLVEKSRSYQQEPQQLRGRGRDAPGKDRLADKVIFYRKKEPILPDERGHKPSGE